MMEAIRQKQIEQYRTNRAIGRKVQGICGGDNDG